MLLPTFDIILCTNKSATKVVFQISLSMLLSPAIVLKQGLRYVQVESKGMSKDKQNKEFHKHYGSSPTVLANIWYDLTTTDIVEARVSEKEQCETGFRMFLVSHYYLWTYPKNSNLLASRFRICERYSRGRHIWKWIERIAALKKKKIIWDPRLNDSNSEIFVVTIDGTDFRAWEKKHPTLPRDNGQCSQKFNHGAVKYEIAISIFAAKVVWIGGSFRGGEHDMTMLREGGLLDKIAPGKLGVVDRGYKSSRPEVESKLSLPNVHDPKELNNFKSRSRLRQETFNGRLKFFNVLSQTFEHAFELHHLAFEAVVVIVQYQMDNGSPIFAV
jgi:hypothetical protein